MRIAKIPDSMTIILNYNNKNLSIVVKKFKKLQIIKEKVYQLFYPIKSDIQLKYNNRDLSSFLDQSIGLLFENKGKVRLQIDPIIGSKRQINRKNKTNSKKNIFNNNIELYIQPSSDRYKSIQTERFTDIDNKSLSPVSTSRKQLLPPIIKNNNKTPYKNLNNLEGNNIKIKYDISSYTLCRECLTNETKHYCRKCNKFICSNCNKKKHKNHLLLKIDITNEITNIEKYKIEIINKLCFALNHLDNLDNIKNNEINEEEWKKKYNEAVNNLASIAQEQKDEIKKNKNNKSNNNNTNNNINQNEYQKRLNKNVEYLNGINISTNKDPFELFNEINRRERIINQTLKERNNKTNIIEKMFIDIENEIDFILFELEEQLNAN